MDFTCIAAILEAMGVSGEDTARFLAARRERRARHLRELERRANEDARRIITFLIERYRPTRVYQWGSLLKPGEFREWSDIDIALEGLTDPLDGLRAADDAASMTDFPVDLVELDRIDPRHASTIREEGRLVHDTTTGD